MEALRESYPPLFRRHARRPRLTRLLDANTAQTILITAPAGYGKTTLLAALAVHHLLVTERPAVYVGR